MPVHIGTMDVVETPRRSQAEPAAPPSAEKAPSAGEIERALRREKSRRARVRAH